MASRDLTLLDPAPASASSSDESFRQAAVFWGCVGLATIGLSAFVSYKAYGWLIGIDTVKVGALGTALGIGGLISALIGFSLTIWQLVKTNRSAQAAAKAVRDVRRDYGSFDAVAELASAKGFNEAIRVSLGARDRASAKLTYDRLRESLVKVAGSPSSLQTMVSTRFKDEAAIVLDALSALREIDDDDQVPWNNMITNLENLDSYMISVSQGLRESIRG